MLVVVTIPHNQYIEYAEVYDGIMFVMPEPRLGKTEMIKLLNKDKSGPNLRDPGIYTVYTDTGVEIAKHSIDE